MTTPPAVQNAAGGPLSSRAAAWEAPIPQHIQDLVPKPNVPGKAASGWQLFDETTATDAIARGIDDARQVVNAEFFGISDAGKGAKITESLVNAAKRGVEVNVIADWSSIVAFPLGSWFRFQHKIEAAGGHVIRTGHIPFSPRAWMNPALKHVDHRKVVTIDGAHGFSGGMNFVKLSDGYHDTMARLDGIAGARLAADELDRWGRAGGEVTARHSAAVADALKGAGSITEAIKVVANAPEQQRFEISNAYLDAIRGVQKGERLWISSPGWSDRTLIKEIDEAVKRGADVRLIAPGTAPLGMPIFNWVGRSHLKKAMELGTDAATGASTAHAYEIPEVLHRKVLIAGDTAILSSFNITGRSRLHDHEIGMITKDPALVETLAAVLKNDAARAKELHPSEMRGITQKIGDFIAQTLRFSY